MERESTKHGPRLDDELVHETSALLHGAPVAGQSRDELRQEDPDEGSPGATTRPDVPERAVVTTVEAGARAELARAVSGAPFPARRTELLEAARHTDADETVIDRLESLPAEASFANVQELWEALGGHHEGRDGGAVR